MSSIGQFIKLKCPGLYKNIVDFINKIISVTQPYSIYITDNLGGSFKNYFSDSNMPLRINALQKNLDAESIEAIQKIVQRLLFYPDAKYKVRN